MMTVGWRPECRWHGCRVVDGICARRNLGAACGLWSLEGFPVRVCTVNDLADSEQRFRDMDLPEVNAEHDKRLKDGATEECYRCISWTEHIVISGEVLSMANTKPTRLDGLRKR